tara:strand:- start:275 stop:409 length:135 start_codon:yes stop_codon:yes gene_type:complete
MGRNSWGKAMCAIALFACAVGYFMAYNVPAKKRRNGLVGLVYDF